MKNIILSELPQPPAGSVFSLQKVETVGFPHLFCITAQHVVHASKYYGGILGEEAIKSAAKQGIHCDICRHNGQILSYEQHEHAMTLFILVPQNKDLNAIPGLHTYLFENKAIFEKSGIQGFAFAV